MNVPLRGSWQLILFHAMEEKKKWSRKTFYVIVLSYPTQSNSTQLNAIGLSFN